MLKQVELKAATHNSVVHEDHSKKPLARHRSAQHAQASCRTRLVAGVLGQRVRAEPDLSQCGRTVGAEHLNRQSIPGSTRSRGRELDAAQDGIIDRMGGEQSDSGATSQLRRARESGRSSVV